MATRFRVNVWRWCRILIMFMHVFRGSAMQTCFQVCDCERPVVRCNLSSLTRVPTFYKLDYYNELQIYGNSQIKRLSASTFEAAWRLNTLTIVNTNIDSLACTAFRGISEYLYTIRLQGNAFTEIPQCVFAQLYRLQHLYITSSPIDSLENDAFINTEGLVTLDLSENAIEDISVGAFTTMQKLKRLSLRGNRLRSLKSQQFVSIGTPGLDMLDLSYNQIETISSDSFGGIGSSLYGLDLSYNRITQASWASVVSVFPSFPNLATLNVSGNPIKIMDSNDLVSPFPRLSTLSVAKCSLSAFVWDNFRHIRSLNVSDNRLPLGDLVIGNKNRTCVPAEGNEDPNVECPEISVDVSGNNLTSLTVLVDYSLSLENVNVTAHNCGIDNASVRIIQNTTGKDTYVYVSLNLSGNKNKSPVSLYVDELGETRWNLSLNFALDLSDNQFQTALESPLKILLSNPTPDTVLEACLFTNRSVEINVLDLSGNGITSIPTASCLVRQVGVLKLNRNKIRQIGKLSLDGTAIGLNRTRVIELRDNNLSSLDAFAFAGLPNLEVVDLRDNSITSIPEMTYLQTLDNKIPHFMMEKNPLVCDCSLAWIVGYPQFFPGDDLRTTRITGRCSLPDESEGFSLLCYSVGKDVCHDPNLDSNERYRLGKVCEGDSFVAIKDFTLSLDSDNANTIRVSWRTIGPALLIGYRISHQSPSTQRQEIIVDSTASNATVTLSGGESYEICISVLTADSVWKAGLPYCGRISTGLVVSTTIVALAVTLSLVCVCLIIALVLTCRQLRRRPSLKSSPQAYSNAYLHPSSSQGSGSTTVDYDRGNEYESAR